MGDLAKQVARIRAFNGGGAGLRAAEGEVMAAREARRQRPEAELLGRSSTQVFPLLKCPL